MSSSDNIITIILLAAVAYVLYTMGLLTPKTEKSSAVSQECPRGQLYSRGLFGDCDPNYKMDWMGDSWRESLSGGNCVCQSKVNKEKQQDISGTAEAAAQDRQATTNPNTPEIASPVIPDSSPTAPSLVDTGIDVLTQLGNLGNWIVNPLGWKL